MGFGEDYYNKLEEDFKKLIAGDKLSHAYLFFGGNERDKKIKLSFALSLSNFLEKNDFSEPAKPLSETLIVQKGEEGTIGIESARSLKHFLYQKPVFSRFRIVVIREAESLTPEAQSAILKIAEEPPEGALIILIVRNEDSLPGALSSRLQRIYFPPGRREGDEINWRDLLPDEIIEDGKIDEFFEGLLADLSGEPVKNLRKLKEALHRLRLIKQFNTNKKLQLRALNTFIKG